MSHGISRSANRSDADVRLHLFGGPRLLKEGGELPVSPHQACLLALAHAHGEHGISRADAAWLLWESDDTPAVRHRLSQLVYGLGKRVGVRCLEETTGVFLKGVLPSDLADFVGALERRAVSALKPLSRLELFSTIASPTAEFSHWVDAKRASVRRQMREVAASEVAEAEAASDWGRAAGAAELLLELDPENEQVLRDLLQACILSRSRTEVDAILRSHAERYRILTEQRWSPGPETIALLKRIDEVERADRPGDAPPTPPLVGRGEEVRELHEALSVQASGVRFAVVAGEAGIGKTRLIRETITRLRLSGCTVLESGSSALQSGLPLHSLLGALSNPAVVELIQELDEPWRSSLAILLPDLPLPSVNALPDLDAQGTSRRLMEALYRLLSKVAAQGPTVLFLDDLQWLDRTTLCSLEFLGERTPPPSLNIVFALRDEAEYSPPVQAFIEKVRTQGVWIRLEELDRASADLLLSGSAPRPLERAERQKLRRAAGQNPFFLIELVNDYCARSGSAPSSDPIEHVPSSIRQLISNRLEQLSREARTLLQFLSVVGTLKVDGPSELDELPPAHLPDLADDLLRARLIEHDAGTIRIRHDLIRQTTYELMGPIKRTVLHRRAANAALTRLGDAGHAEAAVHFDLAGDRAAAFQYAMKAALAAQESGAVPEAIRFWDMARSNATEADHVHEATRRLAELLYDARRIEEAIPLLAAAEASCGDDDAAKYKLMRLDALSELPGDAPDGHLLEVDEIVRRAMEGKEWHIYAEAVEVRLRLLNRMHREDDIVRQLLEVKELQAQGIMCSPYVSCLLNTILSLIVLYRDDDEGILAASTAVRVALDHGIHRLLLRAYHRKLYCHHVRGELHTPEVCRTIQESLDHAENSGDIRSKSGIYYSAGCFYLDTGNYRLADEYFRKGGSLASTALERSLCHLNLGELYYLSTDHETSASHYQRALEETRDRPVPKFIEANILAGLGLCALATGRLATAESLETPVREALDSLKQEPQVYGLIRFLAELERRRGRPEEALEVVRQRASVDRRRPAYWIRSKLLEVRYLRILDRRAADELWDRLEVEATQRGLSALLRMP